MSQITKDILINRVISLFNAGQIKKCLKETLRARKKYPDEPFIYNLLGVLYANMSSYEDTIKNYSKLIPFIGKIIVGDSKPYEYLLQSIDEFLNQEELLNIMENNKFINCNYTNLNGGIVSIHAGWKI